MHDFHQEMPLDKQSETPNVCAKCGSTTSHYYFACEDCGKKLCWSHATHADHDCVLVKRHDQYDYYKTCERGDYYTQRDIKKKTR